VRSWATEAERSWALSMDNLTPQIMISLQETPNMNWLKQRGGRFSGRHACCRKLDRAWLCSLLIWALAVPAVRGATQASGEIETQVGRVHFPISATPAAQAQFDRAVAMLHSFWYEELQREFAKVSELDPDCAMSYWGMAMGLWHPLWDPPDTNSLRAGLAAIEKGKKIGTRTERERAYLDAIGAFYSDYDKFEHGVRVQRYVRAMEKVHEAYPGDKDATAFYALALLGAANPSDRSYTNQLRAAGLLEVVAAAQTNHPGVVHYLIHAYDTPTLAARGLPEAWCYSQIAPEIPHALHMPSHIYTRLGLWQESIKANLASETAAKNYAAKTKMEGTWDEQLHAMDYLVYAYLQTAQDSAVEQVLGNLRASTGAAVQNFKSGYALAAMPARQLLEQRQWARAAKLELAPKTFPWSNHAWPVAMNGFARCVGAARSGKAGDARREFEQLTRSVSAGENSPSYAHRQIAILAAGARGWTEHAEGNEEQALKWMRQATEQEDAIEKKPVTPGPLLPAREQLGELLMELGKPGEALSEFEKALKESPKRFNSLYGAGRAASATGNDERARAYFQELVTSCPQGDSQRAELLEAKRSIVRR
jgi:tetratricopeptide (TPR) repeat protein